MRPRRMLPKRPPVTFMIGLAVIALTAAACSSSSGGSGKSSAGTIDIGILAPETSANAELGSVVLAGARTAVNEINKTGGIKALGGAKLQLIEEDAGGTTSQAISAAQEVLSHKVVGVIGSNVSTLDLAVQQLFEQDHVPMLDTAYADELSSRGFKYTFIMTPPQASFDKVQYPAIEQIAKAAGVNLTRVGIIDSPNAAGEESADAITNTYAPELGWKVVLNKTVQIGSMTGSALTAMVAEIQATKPQLLFVGVGIPDVENIQRGELTEGLKPIPWLLDGNAYMTDPFFDDLGVAGTNGILAVDPVAATRANAGIIAQLKASGQQFANQINLGAYSEIYILATAMNMTKSTNPVEIRNAIAKMDLKSGPAAAAWPCDCVKFGSNGRQAGAVVVIRQWQNGKVVDVYPPKYADGKAVWPTN
jgi:branched-chain amino acid transport system substrate-binding protein